MIVGVAEHLGEDPAALHVKSDVEGVGHADAAMHLHAFLNRRCPAVLAARAKLVVEPPVHRECEIAVKTSV